MTPTNHKILQALGATIEMVEQPHPQSGDWLDARLERVASVRRATPSAFWPNQYRNAQNVMSHQNGTARELFQSLGRVPDAIVVAASTCGTVGGVVSYLDEIGETAAVYAVDAHGSRLFGGKLGRRLIPGLGSSMPARLVDQTRVIPSWVSDEECVAGCRLLARREGILAGGSSGGVAMVAGRVARTLPKGAVVATLLVDRGDRYLDTIYNEQWVQQHLDPTEIENHMRTNRDGE